MAPKKLGFRMPAEWEPHEATWIAWPHEKSDWPGKFAPIPWLYGEIVRWLARVERVRILVEDADGEQSARRVLKKRRADLNAVEFFQHPTLYGGADHLGFQMTNGAGDDLANRGAALGQPDGVIFGGQIANQGGDFVGGV